MPVGTGPFRVDDFRPNDVISLSANSTMPGTCSAPDVITKMVAVGKGVALSAFDTLVERIEMNLTDPSPSLPEGERATCNLVPAPAAFASDNTGSLMQDIEGAKALLEEAGRSVGSNGIRDKDGKKLSLLYQASTNAVRQDFQTLIKQWWGETGVETGLRKISASVFFGSDPGSPDTFPKVYADVEIYANNFDGTDPQSYLAGYTCNRAPRRETQRQGENINRFCDPVYDELVKEPGRTADLGKRGEIAKKLNDMLTKDSYVIVPLVDHGRVSARSNTLGGVALNTWDTELWNAADLYRIKE